MFSNPREIKRIRSGIGTKAPFLSLILLLLPSLVFSVLTPAGADQKQAILARRFSLGSAFPDGGPTHDEQRPPKDSRHIDLRDLLEELSRTLDLSLIVGNQVRGLVRVKTRHVYTVEEILNESLRQQSLSWRLLEGCLYIAEKKRLETFLGSLTKQEKIIAKLKHGKKLSADFRSIDASNLCRIIRHLAGVEIYVADNLAGNMMLRVFDLPWERVLLAVVYLNGFNMVQSEYSITVTPGF